MIGNVSREDLKENLRRLCLTLHTLSEDTLTQAERQRLRLRLALARGALAEMEQAEGAAASSEFPLQTT